MICTGVALATRAQQQQDYPAKCSIAPAETSGGKQKAVSIPVHAHVLVHVAAWLVMGITSSSRMQRTKGIVSCHHIIEHHIMLESSDHHAICHLVQDQSSRRDCAIFERLCFTSYPAFSLALLILLHDILLHTYTPMLRNKQ